MGQHDGWALADQVAIVVQPKSHDRIAFEDFRPGRVGAQLRLPAFGVEALQRLDARILPGRFRQSAMR
jgi:hypothetical protein